jgi:hypothetical protein
MPIDFLLFTEAMENNRKHNRDEDNEKSITAKITSRNTLVLITLKAFVSVVLLLGNATSNPMVYVFGEEDRRGDTDDFANIVTLAQLDNTNSEGSSESGFGSMAGSDPDRTFIHYTEKIAIELSNLTPLELKEYPITELSDEDLKSVLECLTTDNLAKVLLNIPKEDLAEIQDMLNAITFDEIQKMLSEELM